MLTIAEEILLLVLDDESGTFINEPDVHVGYAVAGALLMDLALAHRIDADNQKLFVVSDKPTGDPIQDSILARIVASDEVHDAGYWVGELGRNSGDLRDGLLNRLVERGILKEVDEKVLWVFETRRYPMIDGTEEREVKRRIMDVLFSDSTPEQSDVVIICLADACNLIEQLMSERELRSVEPRIDEIVKMDVIGLAVANTIREIRASIAPMMMM
jgi:hypothetical protein